jgi:hypothetical protein
MAITFRGMAQTYPKFGNDATTQNLFVFENGITSRVNVNIRRFAVQNDALLAYTAVMPIVKASRPTNVSGGVLLAKDNDLDTALNSDPGVQVRAALIDGSPIVATPGTTIWQQYVNRQHTQFGQFIGSDNNALPLITEHQDFKLRPGESVLLQVVSAAAAANPFLSNNWFVTCVWEEDSIATFSISGVVSLNSNPIVGAKVIVVEARDHSLTDAILREVVTTVAGGAWSSTIRTGWVGGAFVQYDNAGALYTAAGSPFLEA